MGRVSGGRIGSSRGLFSKTSSSSSTFSSFRPRIFGGPSIYFRRFDKTSNNNNDKSLSENIKEKNTAGILYNIANILRNIIVLVLTLLFLYFAIYIIYYFVIKKIFKYITK